MNTKQENKLSMFLVVKDFLTTNAALLTPLPNYSAYFTTFQNSITQIQANAEQQQFDKTGIAVNKKQLKQTLITQTLDTAHRIVAYARFANNQILLKEADLEEYQLSRTADTVLRDTAQGIYDRAQTNLTALATYGVTAATQTALQNAITAFVASIPKPRIGITDRKQASTQLQNYMATAENALENIDATVRIIQFTQPNFYTQYKNLRRIINTSEKTLALKGNVTDAQSGAPLKGVTVTIAPDGSAAKPEQSLTPPKDVVKKTADKGGFLIRSLPAGIYTVSFSKFGYTDQKQSIVINDGEMATVSAALAKTP
ncbi:MAG: carboxypeptidase regulatory-like domain-containing protein [Chlorobiales bacterium]|nr:carboxypeptidase regulatory-like domain-containing protein [Chlorobiales bacterium]